MVLWASKHILNAYNDGSRGSEGGGEGTECMWWKNGYFFAIFCNTWDPISLYCFSSVLKPKSEAKLSFWTFTKSYKTVFCVSSLKVYKSRVSNQNCVSRLLSLWRYTIRVGNSKYCHSDIHKLYINGCVNCHKSYRNVVHVNCHKAASIR